MRYLEETCMAVKYKGNGGSSFAMKCTITDLTAPLLQEATATSTLQDHLY